MERESTSEGEREREGEGSRGGDAHVGRPGVEDACRRVGRKISHHVTVICPRLPPSLNFFPPQPLQLEYSVLVLVGYCCSIWSHPCVLLHSTEICDSDMGLVDRGRGRKGRERERGGREGE